MMLYLETFQLEVTKCSSQIVGFDAKKQQQIFEKKLNN